MTKEILSKLSRPNTALDWGHIYLLKGKGGNHFVKKYYLFNTHDAYMKFYFIQNLKINHNPSLLLSTF